MRKLNFNFLVMTILSFGIFLGFSSSERLQDKNPNDSRKNESTSKKTSRNLERQTDNNGGNHQIFGTPYYTDNFDGANDTTSLKARGYKVYYRGTGPQGTTATWFQGNGATFPAFNGPATGYVAANYNVVTGTNNIDSWLVLPGKSVTAGDSIVFYSRAPLNSTFPDSIRVMYSAAGDSVPEAGTWVELGRFKVNTAGAWERKAFGAPSTDANARYAIRYNVVNGGPSGANADFIGIDALTLEAPPIANDIAALSINNPPSNVVLPTSTIAPKATFGNVGTANQTNIPVTFKITGPVNYTSNRTITTLNAGSTIQVTFDSTFNPTVGTYNAVAYSSLASDGFRGNDTVKSTFTVLNPNYGTGGSYSFANSVPGSGAPSQPEFCWKDTAGSTSLVVNSVNSQTGIFNGSLDDGHWKVGNALGGKKIRFGGVAYDSFFVTTNGVIGFAFNTSLNSFSPTTVSTNRPAFYALWIDLNFTTQLPGGQPNRLSYRVADGFQLIITYDRAPEFGPDTTDYVSFQAVIDLVDATYTSDSRMMAQYADATGGRTGADFIALYNANLLNTHVVGLQTTGGTTNLYYRAQNTGSPANPAGPLFGASPIAVQFGPDATRLNHRCGTSSISVTARFEGPFISATNFNDPVTIQLRSSTSPFEIVDGDTKVLDPTGTATFDFGKVSPSGSYYIVVRSRFGIETWSANPVTLPTASYNFTTGVSQAFGNNMRLISGTATIYVGDVNQDGIVDGSDGAAVDNDAFNFAPGFGNTDLNWDGVVDGSDAIYTDNNAFNFVGVIRP